MIKKIAWDTFKNTGDINAFLELKQIENIEKNLEKENHEEKIEDQIEGRNKNGKCEDEWNHIIGT